MDEEPRVVEHLRTLSICHYVYAGLATCFSCLGLLYVGMGVLFGELIKMAPQKSGGPQPELTGLFTFMFTGIGVAIFVGALTLAVLCFLSARGLARRRNRTFSLVVACLCCASGLVNIIGIVLGVFTFIVLLKPETERLYAESPAAS